MVPRGLFYCARDYKGRRRLLSLLAGLDRPTLGAIRVRDRNLSELDTEELARYRRETVGMVFQSFNLLPRMTLEENVELPLRLAEVDRHERKPRVSDALERVGLGLRRQHRPSELSGGEQQRGALARARPASILSKPFVTSKLTRFSAGFPASDLASDNSSV